MATDKRGYWDHEQCRWVGVEPSYVVPPDVTAPVAPDVVPVQRSATSPVESQQS